MGETVLDEESYKRILYDIFNGTAYAGLPIRECMTTRQLAVFDSLDALGDDPDVKRWEAAVE